MAFQEFPADIEWWTTLEAILSAVIVPLIVGGVGAYFGYRIAMRQFKEQQKYLIGVGATQERIEVLRQCFLVSSRVRRGIVEGWQRPGEDVQGTVERLEGMRDIVLVGRSLFLGDTEIRKSLTVINNLLGFDRELLAGNLIQFAEIARNAEESLEVGIKRYEQKLEES